MGSIGWQRSGMLACIVLLAVGAINILRDFSGPIDRFMRLNALVPGTYSFTAISLAGSACGIFLIFCREHFTFPANEQRLFLLMTLLCGIWAVRSIAMVY